MAKIVLNDVTNLNNQASAQMTINSNSDKLEAAIENTLSRDGKSPNEMNSQLDMNGYRIINLPRPVLGTDIVRLQELEDAINSVPGEGSGGGSGREVAYVASLFGLKGLDPSSVKTAILGEEGRKGVFTWTAGDYSNYSEWDPLEGINVASDKVSTTDGMWVRICEPKFVNVLWFGAKGDGETDDTLAIQAAINYDKYATVYLPGGLYVTGPISVGSDITLKGDGLIQTHLVLKAGSTGALLTAHNAVHLVLQDIGFDGNHSNNPDGWVCVVVSGEEIDGNGIWIDRCGFFNAKSSGLEIQGTYSNSRVADCVAEGNLLDGLIIGSRATIVSNNRCVANGRFGILGVADWLQILGNTCNNNGSTGIAVVEADYAIANNNTCLSNGVGTEVSHGIQFNTVNHGVMSGNFVQGNVASGLDAYASPKVTMTGNQTLNNGVRGIEIDTGSHYSTIVGNVVSGNDEVGISIYNVYGAVVANNSVVGNGVLGTATNPVLGAANSPYGIALWGGSAYGIHTRIIGNTIIEHIGSGSNGTGLYIHPSCTGVTLTDNLFVSNTSNITVVNSNLAYAGRNTGLFFEQTGTGTIASGATSVSISFPSTMTVTPNVSNITITPTNNPTTDPGNMYVTSVTASGFTVSCRTNPGSGGATFVWRARCEKF